MSATNHGLCLAANGNDLFRGRVEGNNRGFVQDNSLALHIDQRVGCSEIDRDIRAK